MTLEDRRFQTMLDKPISEHEARGRVKSEVLLMAVRQALFIVLGAIEDYLGLDRSVIPKHRR